jgi:hypothetical protein
MSPLKEKVTRRLWVLIIHEFKIRVQIESSLLMNIYKVLVVDDTKLLSVNTISATITP